jgi:signal transduction histidine kinase
VGRFKEHGGQPIVFQARDDGDGTMVPEDIRLALYRIFQECLNNVKKHAKAEMVLALLDVQPDGIRLVVRDNGVGFQEPRHLGHHIDGHQFGLFNMRARASDVGGKLKLESQPGEGTKITVYVPLPRS